jgi:hypothetical protein
MKKLLTAVALSGALVVSVSTVALGQSYGSADGSKPPTTVSATAKPERPAPKLEDVDVTVPESRTEDRTVTVRFEGFAPLSFADLFIYSDPVYLGRFQADAQGVITAQVIVPDSVVAGNHNIVGSGTAADGKLFSVASPVVLSPASLSFTGSNTGNLLSLAGFLIVVGATGTIAARRRMHPATPSNATARASSK